MRAHRFLSLALAALFAVLSAAPAQDAIDDTISVMLLDMSIEEKVGQMTQLSLASLASSAATPANPDGFALDPEKLRHAIVEKHIGSISGVHDLALTGAQWQELVTQIQQLATTETKQKIPLLYGLEGVHGANFLRGATLFPHNLGFAATRNPELVEQCHAVTARESRAAGIPWNLGPALDVGRQPLWSRFGETFGEDVLLANVLGTAAVRGLQGEDLTSTDRVAATAKHFLAYGYPLSGRDRTQSLLPERYLREYFLPPFIRAVEEGVGAVMVNPSEVNGLPVHANNSIVTKLLRGQMGFQGVVVSGWNEIRNLHEAHRVAPTMNEAVGLAVEAGIDICVSSGDFEFTDRLVELVRDGYLLEERLDESVAGILRLKFNLGLFENPLPDPALLDAIGTPEAAELSLQAARESLVLLKNDGALPAAPETTFMLTGPGCHSLAALHGAWSYTRQGADEAAYPAELDTILEAFNEAYGRDNVVYTPGVAPDGTADYDKAVTAAQFAEVIVCVLAEPPATEAAGNLEDLALPEAQRTLVRKLALGKPLVLVLLTDRPRLITDVAGLADAIVFAGRPGPHGGQALRELLVGDVNPSGKLPFTYPRDPHHLLTYDHKLSDRVDAQGGLDAFDPLFEFGHGLSYTTFQYANLNVPPDPLTQFDTLSVSIDVTNSGDRAGSETVHLYVRDLYASVVPPVKRLRAFRKITLDPGATETVVFDLPATDLAFFGPKNYPILEPGDFEVTVGGQTATVSVQ